MIPIIKVDRPGALIYDIKAGLHVDGWQVHSEHDIVNEDPAAVMRGAMAAMLIFIAKQHGINLCLGKDQGDPDVPVPLAVERDVMDLLAKVKAK